MIKEKDKKMPDTSKEIKEAWSNTKITKFVFGTGLPPTREEILRDHVEADVLADMLSDMAEVNGMTLEEYEEELNVK